MALFDGEEMISITMPDGRVQPLPRSVIPASFIPAQVPSVTAPVAAPAPVVTPAPTTLIPPEPVQDAAQVQNTPDYTLGAIDTEELAQADAAQQKAIAERQAAQTAYEATPAGAYTKATQEQQKAVEAQVQAGREAAKVTAAGELAKADAYAAYGKELAALQHKQQREAEADLAAITRKNAEAESFKNKIANTKIDRTADHPVIASLGIALGVLGAAIKGDSANPALDMFYKALDRKVAGQMADLDQLKTLHGMTKDEVQSLKDTYTSRLALNNMLASAASARSANQLEEIKARTSSNTVRANSELLAAQLRERAEQQKAEAVKFQMEFEQKEKHQKQQIGLGYAGIAQQRYATDLNAQLDRGRIAAELMKAELAEQSARGSAAAKAKLEMIKDNETRGMRNVVTKQPLLTKAGREAMERADQIEAKAASLEASGKGGNDVTQMREQAAAIRSDALITGQVRASDPTSKNKIGEQWAASQGMMQLIDEINELYDQEGRGYITRTAAQEQIQAKTTLLALKGKAAWQLGAWDKGAERITEKIMPLDPTSGWDVGVLGAALNRERIKDPAGFKKRLEGISQSLTQDIENVLSVNTTWDDKGKLFARKGPRDTGTPQNKASQKLSEARTPVEAERKAESSWFKRNVVDLPANAARSTYSTLTGSEFESKAQERTRLARESGSITRPGLSEAQTAPFDALFNAYKAGDKASGDELVAKIANSAEYNPELATAMLTNLQTLSPNDLYQKARQALPVGSAAEQQISTAEKNQIAVSDIPTSMLTTAVVLSIGPDGKVGDNAGYAELAARNLKGDPEAKQALADIVKRSGTIKGAR